MAEFQVPNPEISLATANSLGDIQTIEPVNFYNPMPVKNYSTGLVNQPAADPLGDIANKILDGLIKDINKDKGLTNKLTNPKQVPLSQTERYQDPQMGYVESPNIEFMYGEKQGFAGALGAALTQSAGNFVSSFLGSFTNEYAIGAAVAEGDLSKLFDNDLVNAANSFSELGQDWGVVYDTRQMQDNPLFSRKLMTSTISSLGYLGAFAGAATKDVLIAGALGPQAGIGLAGVQLTQMFNKMGNFTKIFSNGEKGVEALNKSLQVTRNLTQAVNNASKTVPLREGFRKFNQYTQGMFEASIEAKETVDTIESKLKEEYFLQNGYNPAGEELEAIKTKANEAGNWTYFANAALLTTTNHFEFGDMFERWRVGKRAFDAKQGGLDLGLDGYNKIINNTPRRAELPSTGSIFDKAKAYGVRAAQATPSVFTMSTGEFIEEMGQGIISGGTEDYYANFLNPPSSGIDSLLRATAKQFGTQEGWLSGLSGILTGAAMSGIMSAAGINPMDKTPSNVYADHVINELNNENIGAFLKEKIKADQIKKTGAVSNGLNIKSEYQKKSEEHLNSFQYWLTGLKHKQYDLRQDQLQQARNLEGKDFTDEWGLEYTDANKATINDFIDEQVRKGQHVKEVFDMIDKTFINPFDKRTRVGRSADNSESYALYDAVKDELVFQVSKFDNNKDYMSSLMDGVRKNTSLITTPDELINLSSIYGEDIEDGYNQENGNIFKKYTVKSKAENTNQGLAKVRKDLDAQLKDIQSQLTSELIVGDDRAAFKAKEKDLNSLVGKITDLMDQGLTEIVDEDGITKVKYSDDYHKFLSEYLVVKRRESGIKEPLTGDQYAEFFKDVSALSSATLSNNRTSKIINDLLGPNAIKKFKAEGDKIKAYVAKIQEEAKLVAEEEAKTAPVENKADVVKEKENESEETPNEEKEEDTSSEETPEPEKGDEFEGNVFVTNEDGEEDILSGTFEVVDVDKVDDMVTIRHDGEEITISKEDFEAASVTKVDPTTKVKSNNKASTKKTQQANVELTDEQAEELMEVEDALADSEVVAYYEDIVETNLEDNTITVQDENGDTETLKTLTNALGQKYSEDVDPIFKKVAIESSMVMHALFNEPNLEFGGIENDLTEINAERFEEIKAGVRHYNQWLIDNNKEIVNQDFYIKDYEVNGQEDNDALVHIDLLLFDKVNNLYQIVDFKTRSKTSSIKNVNGVKGNSPYEWDKAQLDYKADLIRKTLSNADIKTKPFDNINYLFPLQTTYNKKQLTKIEYMPEPKAVPTKDFKDDIVNSNELKIAGHTLTSLRNLPAKDFIATLKQNKIPFKKLKEKNGLIDEWNRIRERLGEDLPAYDDSTKNLEFWEWAKEEYAIFKITEESSALDPEKIDAKIEAFLQKLNEDVFKEQGEITRNYIGENGVATEVFADWHAFDERVVYTNADYRLNDGDITEITQVLREREQTGSTPRSSTYYVHKPELFVKTNFTERFKVFVNGRKENDTRTPQQIIDSYGTTNLKRIIEGISKNSNFTAEKELASNILSKIPLRFNVEFIDSSPKDSRVTSHYDPLTEKLVINVEMLKELGYSIDNAILHEAIHVLTAQKLRTNTKFIQDMDVLLNETRSFVASPEGRVVLNNIYGTSNIEVYGLMNRDEFVSEALTSPDFQNLLRSINAKVAKEEKITLWSKFIDYVRRTLGIQVQGFEDTLLAKTVYRVGKEFDTLSVEDIGNSLNVNYMFGKTILKMESNDQYADTNAFGNKVIRENSLNDILNNAIVVKETGAKENFKPLTGFDNIFVSKYPYNLVLKYPNGDGGHADFTSLGLVAGYRFKRTRGGSKTFKKYNVTQQVYDIFVESNIVERNILESIAAKVIDRDTLTPIEQSILAGKTSEINTIIATIPPLKTVSKTTVMEGLNPQQLIDKYSLVGPELAQPLSLSNMYNKGDKVWIDTFGSRKEGIWDGKGFTDQLGNYWEASVLAPYKKELVNQTAIDNYRPTTITTTSSIKDDGLLTLDQLGNQDISDEEFEEITHVDRSLRSEFMDQINNYITFQTTLANKATDTPLKDANVEISINPGTLQLVPYANRTDVNELKPMMFRGADGRTPAPLILERTYTWERGAGKTRATDSGYSSIYNDAVFEDKLAGVMEYLQNNISTINTNLKSTYVLVIPKGGIQTDKTTNFDANDFDFVPVYPEEYDINDNSYLNGLKTMSNYITKNNAADLYEESIAAEKVIKSVYVSAPESYQFQNIDNTMSANAAEISINDGNNSSKAKGYLQYRYKSSTGTDDLMISISPERLESMKSMQELINAINDELEVKIKGTVNVPVAFKVSASNFKQSLPNRDEIGTDAFLDAINQGKLVTPLHKNVRNVSLNVVPLSVMNDIAQPKDVEVVFSEPAIPAQQQAQEINEEITKPKAKPTPAEIRAALAKKQPDIHSRKKPYGFRGLEYPVEDMITICG